MSDHVSAGAVLRGRAVVVNSLVRVVALGLLVAAGWAVVTTRLPEAPSTQPCTDEWFSYVDENYSVSDGERHGPDRGSAAWFNAFERRAGLPVADRLPSAQRCQLIQQRLESQRFIVNDPLGIATSF